MHTIQYIATRANSADEAFDFVKSTLEKKLGGIYDETNTWYDWFVAGGGRWSSGDGNQYNHDWKGDVAHQSDPRFEEYLEKAHKYRHDQLTEYEAEARKLNLIELLDKLEDFEHDSFRVGMDLYPIKKIYDLCMGVWDHASYFYDMVNDSINRIHMKNAIDNGDTKWYLVPVDFHF